MTKKGYAALVHHGTGRGAAALPSLIGKVAHAKRVTDELSSRFRKQLCPAERKIIESQAASFNETVV